MSAPVTMWQRAVPTLLSTAFPARPSEPGANAGVGGVAGADTGDGVSPVGAGDVGLVYEYKVLTLEAGGTNWRATILVRLASENPGADGGAVVREELRPQRLAHDMRVRSGVAWAQSSAANPVLRFSDDVPYMLHDRRYRCDGAPGCGASMRIRAWAAVSDVPTRDASKAPRTCAHCGRKGHRKQSCCEQPGNCRVEVEWCHNHPIELPTGPGILEGAPIDPTAPPPAALLNGDPNGTGKRLSDPYGGTGSALKKSRPSTGASFAPVPPPIPCGAQAGSGCSCEAARAARARCQEKLVVAQEALRALHDSVQDLAALHDNLSSRAQAQAGALCTIEQLTIQRDQLRAEIEELWQQRASLQPEPDTEPGLSPGDAGGGNGGGGNVTVSEAMVGVSTGIVTRHVTPPPGQKLGHGHVQTTSQGQVHHPPPGLRPVPVSGSMVAPMVVPMPMPVQVSMAGVSINGAVSVEGSSSPSPSKLGGVGAPQMVRMHDGQATNGTHSHSHAHTQFVRIADDTTANGVPHEHGEEPDDLVQAPNGAGDREMVQDANGVGHGHGHGEADMVEAENGDPQMVRMTDGSLEGLEQGDGDVEPGAVTVDRTKGVTGEVILPSDKVHKVEVALSGGDVHQEVLEFGNPDPMECGDNTETDDK